MFKTIAQYYQYFCNLSLDVVLGVLLSMLPLPFLFHVQIHSNWYFGLPLSAWFVYLADHFLDIYLNPFIDTPRHQFIKRNKNYVIAIMVVLFIAILGLLFYHFQLTFLITGILVGLLCLIYFVLLAFPKLIQRIYFPNKELAVAFIYASGIYSSILSQTITTSSLLYYVIFMAIAYQSLIFNSMLEIETDLLNKQVSAVVHFGLKNSSNIFHMICFVIVLSLLIMMFIPQQNKMPLTFIYLIMAILNYQLYRYGKKSNQLARVRILSEMVFWLPACCLLF